MVYSDQLYRNCSLSLHKFLKSQEMLTEVDIQFLEEFDSSKYYTKPFLLIAVKNVVSRNMGTDGGFRYENIDDPNKKVDTIHGKMADFDFQLDLGADTAADREKWGAVIDRIFEDIEGAGIPVYNLSADLANTDELGRFMFVPEEALAHNLLPQMPELQTWQDSIRFMPEYLHKFIKTANQELLEGVELHGKRN